MSSQNCLAPVVGKRPTRPRQVEIAHAHTGTQSYVYLVVNGATVTGNVQFPVADLNELLSLSIPQGEPGGGEAMVASLESIRGYATDHVSITDTTGHWPVVFDQVRFLAVEKGSYVVLDYRVPELRLSRPARLTIFYDGIVESKPEHDSLLIVRVSRGWGRLQRRDETQLPMDARTTQHVVAVGRQSFGEDLSVTLTEGVRRLVRLPGRVARRLRRLSAGR